MRTVHHGDGIAFLADRLPADHAIITSLPDHSERPALGVDGWRAWFVETVALACRAMRMTPAEAIVAATINGAYALGRGDRVGSIERGKEADLLVLSAPDYRELPYHFGVNLVETTIRRGQIIYRQAEVTWTDK